jgi:ATP-dependent RNA helicase DeaD
LLIDTQTREPLANPATGFSAMRLSDTTLAALARMGIDTPTPIQAEALPALLDGRDVTGQARTGSGKTLAFGIPAAEIIDTRDRSVQVLVLTPTRELAVQVGGVLAEVSAGRGIEQALIFGGRALGPQRDQLRKGVHIVVGTPGRVLDLLNQGVLWLDRVRFLVLDEADEMLDRGFAPDVERIIARANASRQTALFSATLPDWVRKTADRHLNDPVAVAVDPNPEDAAPIDHVAYEIPGGDKLGALKELLDARDQGSIIVFGRTKHGVKKLARQLEASGYPVVALQGNLSQNARDRVMEDFRSGEAPILVATNVAARGLDVSHVAQVINVELPESPELLTHRVGRTGRMGRQGRAITLLGPEDGAKWRQLERGLGRRIPRVRWSGATSVNNAPECVAPVESPSSNGQPSRRNGSAMPAPATSDVAPAADLPRPRRTGTALPRLRGRSGTSDLAAHAGSDRTAIGIERPRRGERPLPQRRRSSDDASGPERERGQRAAGWDDPRAEVIEGDTRRLVANHGRDPRRPSWVGPSPARGHGDEGDASSTHRVDCWECGQPAEVPFRPDPTRPVYCAECFRDRRGGQRRASA